MFSGGYLTEVEEETRPKLWSLPRHLVTHESEVW